VCWIQNWDIGQVLSKNFNWLPFTPPPLVAFSGPSYLFPFIRNKGDLVRESGATPIHVFQDLTPEAILDEIWSGSWELHLIGAPMYVLQEKFG
jgi:hypothetical protein